MVDAEEGEQRSIEDCTMRDPSSSFIIRSRDIRFSPQEGDTLFEVIEQAYKLVQQDDGAGRGVSHFELRPHDPIMPGGAGMNVEVQRFIDTFELGYGDFLHSCDVTVSQPTPNGWVASVEYLTQTLSQFGGEQGIFFTLHRGKHQANLNLNSPTRFQAEPIPFWQAFKTELAGRSSVFGKAKLIGLLALVPPFITYAAARDRIQRRKVELPHASASLYASGPMNPREVGDLITLLDTLGVAYEHKEGQLHVYEKQPAYNATISAQVEAYRKAAAMGFAVELVSHGKHGEVRVGEWYKDTLKGKVVDLGIECQTARLQPPTREDVVRSQHYIETHVPAVTFKEPWVIHTYTVNKLPSDTPPTRRNNTVDIVSPP